MSAPGVRMVTVRTSPSTRGSPGLLDHDGVSAAGHSNLPTRPPELDGRDAGGHPAHGNPRPSSGDHQGPGTDRAAATGDLVERRAHVRKIDHRPTASRPKIDSGLKITTKPTAAATASTIDQNCYGALAGGDEGVGAPTQTVDKRVDLAPTPKAPPEDQQHPRLNGEKHEHRPKRGLCAGCSLRKPTPTWSDPASQAPAWHARPLATFAAPLAPAPAGDGTWPRSRIRQFAFWR